MPFPVSEKMTRVISPCSWDLWLDHVCTKYQHGELTFSRDKEKNENFAVFNGIEVARWSPVKYGGWIEA